ncbi:MAG: Lrp/AsnC family transcriptional regulator [Phocaeicola sp.]|uniref:Lrp/AsnC family transcriptional regulator n=1 Tax=Phocaeicola sp. TaxID=2773926 RepID=UPI003FA04215
MMKHQIDQLDWEIINMLATNARMPFLEIARLCNVSGAAIHQRVEKLTRMGVLKGTHWEVDPEEVGYGTCAFVGLYLKDPTQHEKVVKQLQMIPEVTECHYTTGQYDMLIKVYAKSNHHLLSIIHEQLQKLNIARSETLVSFKEAFNRQVTIPKESSE